MAITLPPEIQAESDKIAYMTGVMVVVTAIKDCAGSAGNDYQKATRLIANSLMRSPEKFSHGMMTAVSKLLLTKDTQAALDMILELTEEP